ADARQPLLVGVPGEVVAGRRGGEPATGPPHHLVHDQHPRGGSVLGQHVAGEEGGLLGGAQGTQRLPDRDHVVVDRLGQPHHGEADLLLGEVGSEVGGGGVGVVAADGVQDVDTVGDQTVGRDLEGGLVGADQSALAAVLV